MFDVIAEGIMRFNRVHTDGVGRPPRAHEADPAHPGARANATLRQADYSAVIARYAARRIGEPPEALGPQLVGQLALGASNAAYSEWLRDESSDLVELVHRAFAMVRFEPESLDGEAAPLPARARTIATER